MAKTNEKTGHAELVSGSETVLHTHAPPALDGCSAPTGPVDFSGQQALSFVIENRTSDPPSPVTGQIWLRTDL